MLAINNVGLTTQSTNQTQLNSTPNQMFNSAAADTAEDIERVVETQTGTAPA